MYFYEIEGLLVTSVMEEEANRIVKRQQRIAMGQKAARFNGRLPGKAYILIKNLAENSIELAYAASEKTEPLRQAEKFLRVLSIEARNLTAEEIKMEDFREDLRMADSSQYVDRDKVEELLELDGLRGILYGEKILADAPREEIYKSIEKFLLQDTLLPELDRIYRSGGSGKPQGHPVHYTFETDDHDTRKYGNRALLQALYANGRIQCRRYSYIDIYPDRLFQEDIYEPLYKLSEGGVIIVRYNRRPEDDAVEDSHASMITESIENVCKLIKRYRNKVLTIIDLPRDCMRARSTFYDNLESISVVELREELALGERARAFLKSLARETGVRTDKALFGCLMDGEGYLSTDLHRIFDNWYDAKLKRSIYPEYSCVTTLAENGKEYQKAKGNAYEELQAMIGLSETKRVIDEAIGFAKMQRRYRDLGMQARDVSMHMVFTGNPGTAKTSVARLYARIMRDNGILSNGHLVEVGRSDLVGRYVGWTADLVKKKFKEAKGGVLFIDEAYSLLDDKHGMYGDEAINTIVQEMENHRNEVIVIFAGYPREMEAFIRRNPGLRSRTSFHVHFEDYSTSELCDIARLLGARQGVKISAAAMDRLEERFELAQSEADFGNGRYVRNVIEQARMHQAARLLSEDIDHLGKEKLCTIEAEDIIDEKRSRAVSSKVIGFAC